MAGKLGFRVLGLGLFGLMTAMGSAACSGDAGPAGQQGLQGPEGPPGSGSSNAAVAAMLPSTVFQGRTADVTIIGSATAWDDATLDKLDFGEGVVVKKKTRGSAASIVVSLEIDEKAPDGARDVHIGDDVYSAFTVSAGAKNTLGDTPVQGGLVSGHIDNLDLDHPFDATTDLFGTPVYMNIKLPDGMAASFYSVTPTSADYILATDVTTPVTSADIVVESGAPGSVLRYTTGDSFKSTTRSATPFTLGTPATGDVTSMFGSTLYSFDAPDSTGAILALGVTGSSSSAAPEVILLGEDGSFANVIDEAGVVHIAEQPAGKYYLVTFDGSGESGYTYTLTGSKIVPTRGQHEVEPNDDFGSASPLMTPGVVEGATLSAETDADWYAIALTAADSKKSLHVATSGNAADDYIVTLFNSDGTTALDSSDGGNQEDATFTLPAITAAKTVYVQITWSSDYTAFPAAPPSYDLLVDVE